MFEIYFYTYVMGMFTYIPVDSLCYSAGFIWTSTWNIFMIHGHSPKTIIHQLDREITRIENELEIEKDMIDKYIPLKLNIECDVDKKLWQRQHFMDIRKNCYKALSLYPNADIVCEISQGGHEKTIPYVSDDGYVSEGESI